MFKKISSLFIMATLITPVFSSEIPVPNDASLLSTDYKGKSYSPYAKRDFPSRPLWGDSHLHTGLSFDAGAFGNTLGHEEAYRFARGEEVMSSHGVPVRLSRPLDWLAITDHSDNMGFYADFIAGKPELLKDPQGKKWYDMLQKGENNKVALEMISLFANGKFPKNLMYSPDSKEYKTVWANIIKTAEKYNNPGYFTALIGYEWTSLAKGGNMHRNVLYRNNGDVASQMVPYSTIPPLGSIDPMDLWKWMAHFEKETGGHVLAVAHNGNLSNGIMFPVDAQYTGRKLDKKYVSQRAQWEPLYEITQIKGDGEAHPFLSPEDEFADYETWDIGNLDSPATDKTDSMLQYEYAREALKNGLALEKKFGTNPYKMGFVGATDSHTGLATAQEDNFFGKHSAAEPSPARMEHPFIKAKSGKTLMGWQTVASGLGAVWAKENTRESIFDAMKRKEVYGTTGSRMTVRFFGGWDFTTADLKSRTPAFVGYEKGVPMGGDLKVGKGKKSPTFMVYALRDPIGGNLDRIQIVKGWLDKNGKTHEKVYDVVWAGNRKAGKDGKLPPVGNTVDAKTASFTNTIGASELGTVWTDPSFDRNQKAFYYARVLEIPTPRWSTIEAFRFGVPIPEGAPVSTQERAYTSPIWYSK
jgi:hypothetical protein